MQQKEKQDNNAMGMKKRMLKAWQMSTRMLYAMIGVTAVVFALFYLVGYDMPYVFDPDYNAPLLTDIVLIFIYLMVVGAVGVLVFSLYKAAKIRSAEKVVNGIPVARIKRWSAMAFVAMLVLAYVAGSADPLSVNGKTFSDATWLKVADMFIYTVFAMLLAAVVAVAVSVGGSAMRRKNRKKEEK